MNKLSLLALLSALSSTHGGHSGSTVHVCNRGFCYNKKEDSSIRNSPSLHKGKAKRRGNGVCSGPECELYSILGEDIVEEGESVECVNCPPSADQKDSNEPNDTWTELDFHMDILDEVDLDKRRSWREEPQKGSCYDKDLGYLFDCNLVSILNDGLVLIEDLRSGGAFATEPSTFHLHKDEKKKNEIHVPNVVVTGEDPNEDYRTNIELNMMGI